MGRSWLNPTVLSWWWITQCFPDSLLRHLPHDDAERVRFFDNKDRWLNCSINRLYRIMKSNVVRARGSNLTLAEREHFYRVAAENVNAAVGNGRARLLTVQLGETAMMPGDWALTCSLDVPLSSVGREASRVRRRNAIAAPTIRCRSALLICICPRIRKFAPPRTAA